MTSTAELAPPREVVQDRFGAFAPFLIFLILIGATIPWRSKTYFAGAFDTVVLAKAALSLVALGLAYLSCRGRPSRPLRAGPVVFVLLYLACTVFGGWSGGGFFPSAVIAVRVLLLLASVVILSRCFEPRRLLGSVIGALAVYTAVGAATGVLSLAEGRLRGGVPPLHPNELASTCALVIIWCTWKVLAGRDTWWHVAGIAMAATLMLLTGSRTPLVALAVASLVLIAHASAVRLRTLAMTLLAVPVLIWVFGGTNLLSQVVLRDEDPEGLTTLSNRTIAWQAALAPKSSPWVEWVGSGLATKRIQVAGQYWNEQILDSSWISALVQGGLIGLGICVLWILVTAVSTLSSPRELRGLQLTLLVYLAGRGVLESGLFDASTAFLVLIVVCLASPVRDRTAAWQPT